MQRAWDTAPPHGPVGRLLVGLGLCFLDAYKRWLSPLLPRSCRFSPTCSEYARLALQKHGVVRGSVAAVWRIARCHPLSAGGIDIP